MFLACQLSVYCVRARVNQISRCPNGWVKVRSWWLVSDLWTQDLCKVQNTLDYWIIVFSSATQPILHRHWQKRVKRFLWSMHGLKSIGFLEPAGFFFFSYTHVKVWDDRQEDTWPAWQRPTWPTLWLLPRSGACLKWQEKPNQPSFLWMRPVESCFRCVTWRLKHLHVVLCSKVVTFSHTRVLHFEHHPTKLKNIYKDNPSGIDPMIQSDPLLNHYSFWVHERGEGVNFSRMGWLWSVLPQQRSTLFAVPAESLVSPMQPGASRPSFWRSAADRFAQKYLECWDSNSLVCYLFWEMGWNMLKHVETR